MMDKHAYCKALQTFQDIFGRKDNVWENSMMW